MGFNGQLNLILGGMYSGKTSELFRRYNRYTIGGKKCIMIKYKNDTRYDANMVVTHDNVKVNAIVCEALYEIDSIIKLYDVICVDEIQFYKDGYIFADKWANEGKIVEVCGLNGTFNRTPFDVVSRLIPKAENITFLKAICKETGNDAVFSQLNDKDCNVDKETSELIGGTELYSASDRETYFKNNDDNSLKEYLELYAKANGYPNIDLQPFILNYDKDKDDYRLISDRALRFYLSFQNENLKN